MSDFDFEPIPGLPERPPQGEHILWQGAPDWQRVARDVYHVDKVALYFAALLVLKVGAELWSGASLIQALQATGVAAVWIVPLAVVAVAILLVLAYLTGRTTIYTITSRRVVIRFGIALPMTVNLPYRTIGTVGLNTHTDGTGDIPLSIVTSDRIAYLVMWPHARPWRFSRPEPMLRSVPQAALVGGLLVQALSASVTETAAASVPVPASRMSSPVNHSDVRQATALAS